MFVVKTYRRNPAVDHDRHESTGLRADLYSGALPAGRLVIDRAGYDQESSPLLFSAAAELLLHVLLAGAFAAPSNR
ncbi:hypothetical protein [Kitasatospora sp. NPDC058190]|uniref:hypothetical protein n=1 Tax=Kitasatospora sp. NPDC058190 TaxID=3346371 RepID=UPI0036DB07A3